MSALPLGGAAARMQPGNMVPRAARPESGPRADIAYGFSDSPQ